MTRTIEKKPVEVQKPQQVEQATETPDHKKIIDSLIASVRKEFGQDSIHRMSDVDPVNERLPLNISNVDVILGGGLPKARLIQVIGGESVGKSTFVNFIAGAAQRSKDYVHFEDGEMSQDRDRAEDIGVNPDLLTYSEPETLEQSFAHLAHIRDHFVEKEASAFLILDSIAALPTQADLAAEYDQEARRAARASFLSAKLPKLVRPIAGTRIGMIFVNQLREKANAVPFGKNTYAPGGRALRHWCHLTLELTRIGALKEHGEIVGIRTRIRVEKSKLQGIKPTSQAFVKIYFDGRIVEDEDGGSRDDD